MRRRKLYALYKGDEFLNLGTKEELAKWLGVRVKTISYYAAPAWRKKIEAKVNSGKAYIVVKIEEEENV